MRQNDNRNWKAYPREYATQIRDLMTQHDMFVTTTDVDDDTGNLIFYDNLHTNWMDLYSILFDIYPKTVFEVGCGSGQHLSNVQIVLPDSTVYGCDINGAQMEFGRTILCIDEELYQNVQVLDFALPTIPQYLGKTFDAVYSQAVLMHLSHANAYGCLRNMLKISNKYVILIENPDDHNYNTMLNQLRETEGYELNVTYPAIYGSDLYLIEKI